MTAARPNPLFGPDQTVLFQGDSITDAGRDRSDPASLGSGYAAIAAGLFHARFPDLSVRFLNRGVSGNRVKDLAERWDRDCLALRPDWVSVLIGVNDTWRRYDRGDPTPVEEYEAGLRSILRAAHEAGAGLIVCEPFVLPVPEDRRAWREDLDRKIHAARRVAAELRALYVPFDGLFAAAAARREPACWAPDGVHPSFAGHAMMAEAWLRAVGAG